MAALAATHIADHPIRAHHVCMDCDELIYRYDSPLRGKTRVGTRVDPKLDHLHGCSSGLCARCKARRLAAYLTTKALKAIHQN